MSCGVGHRHCSDLVFLWLWRRPEAAALIQPLAWKPPYAAGTALKRKKNKKSPSFVEDSIIVLAQGVQSFYHLCPAPDLESAFSLRSLVLLPVKGKYLESKI